MRALPLAALAMAMSAACANEEQARSPEIAFSVAFPSAAAAVATETLRVFVFEGALHCNDLVRLRQTQQVLPATVAETPSLTPCQLQSNQGNDLSLKLKQDYTMLAVGQIGGQDVFVGCALQYAYGSTKALSIPLTFIDDRQKLAEQQCTRLSDKCNGLCR